MRILHSADWQLGCAFSGFGAQASALRAQRLATLQRALELAREEKLDAFLIAGDLFEDNQVAQTLLAQVANLFASFPELPIFILPGNHDAMSGPGCIWLRAPFAEPPPNVTVIREAGAIPLGTGYLIGNPLTQKLSTRDPSVRVAEIAATLPADAVKIGVTHGALAIEGKHQPNDHPIHLEAASRGRLEYLALGHWHRWQTIDGGRTVMPGTPEPDAFDHADGRFVARVDIGGPGQAPVVRQVPVAALSWRELHLDFQDGEPGRASLDRELGELQPQAGANVVRVVLKGPAERQALANTRAWVESALQPFVAAEVVDESKLALSAAEIAALGHSHPLLGQVLADLSQARVFATGQLGAPGTADSPLTYPEFQKIAANLELDVAELDEAFFKMAADVLARKLQEAGA